MKSHFPVKWIVSMNALLNEVELLCKVAYMFLSSGLFSCKVVVQTPGVKYVCKKPKFLYWKYTF